MAVNFERLSSNIDIMTCIYQMLSFSDQLRLSRVSVTLQHIFEIFIWTDDYSSMTIIKRPPMLIVTNDLKMKFLFLEHKEFEEFLEVYADSVRDLSEISGSTIEYFKLHNLTSLSFSGVEYAFDFIGDCCPLLANIDLRHCTCVTDKKYIAIGRHWGVSTWLKMKNLQSLKILGPDVVSIRYSHFLEIVCNLEKLNDLQLTALIIPVQKITKSNEGSHLKVLHIVTTFEARYWPTNFSSYLKNFETLEILQLQFVTTVTDDILATVAATCINLQQFVIRLTTFKNIELFSLPPQVCQLSLYCCGGLSYENLKYLLTQPTIQKFSSVETKYKGVFEEFPMSSSIQSLQVDAIDMRKFQSAYDGNEALNELTWYDPSDNVWDAPLESFASLEVLAIEKGYIPSWPTLVQTKSLRKLSMCATTPYLKWSDIIAVLKHSSLQELSIGCYWNRGEQLARVADIPLVGFSVGLGVLRVHLITFEIAMDFWLDLFRQNTSLQLIAYGCQPGHKDVIQRLVNHKYFPKTLRTISVCGFKLSCRDLRRRFDDVMDAYGKYVYYNYERDTIILCRN